MERRMSLRERRRRTRDHVNSGPEPIDRALEVALTATVAPDVR